MKKIKMKKIRISNYHNQADVFSIWIENIRYHSDVETVLKKIISTFTEGEMFFLCYKTDGINISYSEFLSCGQQIYDFFMRSGKVYQYPSFKRKKAQMFSSDLVAFQMSECSNYNIIYKMFHYFLDTVLFSTNIDWDVLLNLNISLNKNIAEQCVMNSVADFVCSYVDSGDFVVTFNPNIFNPDIVYNKINEIVFG